MSRWYFAAHCISFWLPTTHYIHVRSSISINLSTTQPPAVATPSKNKSTGLPATSLAWRRFDWWVHLGYLCRFCFSSRVVLQSVFCCEVVGVPETGCRFVWPVPRVISREWAFSVGRVLIVLRFAECLWGVVVKDNRFCWVELLSIVYRITYRIIVDPSGSSIFADGLPFTF